MRRRALAQAILALALGIPALGCSEDAIDLGAGTPTPPADQGPAISPPARPGVPQPGDSVDSYPFDFARYQAEIWPQLQRSCAQTSCHGGYEQAPGGALALHPEPTSAALHYQNFLRVRDFTNLDDPPFSLLLLEALNESSHGAGAVFPSREDARYLAFLAWIDDAAQAAADGRAAEVVTADPEQPEAAAPAGRCGAIPDVRSSRYDFDAFAGSVQPTLDADCASAGCHLGSGAGRLDLEASADPTGCAIERNFFMVQRFAFPRNVAASTLVLKPLSPDHTGGAIFAGESDARYVALAAWIAAVGEPQGGFAPPPPASRFDYVRFQQVVAPVLLRAQSAHNCADRSCHGAEDRASRGALFLFADPAPGSPEMASDFHALTALADVERPESSRLLGLAAGAEGHRVVLSPDEPGRAAIVEWIYAARGYTRLDPVYFAQRVNPLFDDPAAAGGAGQALTCADTGCHGTYDTARGPANRSRFGLVPAAETPGARAYNFRQASNLVSLSDPARSPLLLQPLATDEGGVHHTGGDNWHRDGEAFQRVWRWIDGMHPSADGFIRDWLVVGPFAPDGDGLARPYLDEADPRPAWGEAVGASTWEARLAGDGDRVATGGGGVYYAAAWLVNESGGERTVDLSLGADGFARAWLGGQVVLDDRADGAADPGGLETTVGLTLKPGANLVLVKTLWAGDGEGGFYLKVHDRDGGDAAGYVTVKLGDVGGAPVGAGEGIEAPVEDPQGDAYDALDAEAFRVRVVPVLASAGGGCASGAGCHQARAGGFYFDPAAAQDDAIAERVLRSLSSPRMVNLDPGQAEESRLLAVPRVGSAYGHAGGKAWSQGDASYQTILAWIRDASSAP